LDTLRQDTEPRRWLRTTDSGQSFIWLELNASDIVLTALATALGFSEGNPLLGFLLSIGGTGALIFYRIIVTLAVLAFIYFTNRMRYLRWLNLGIGVIVLWNAWWLALYAILAI